MPTEHYDHDDCPACGCPSVPFEGVQDQALRGCPRCNHEWWEQFDRAPYCLIDHLAGVAKLPQDLLDGLDEDQRLSHRLFCEIRSNTPDFL